MDAGRGPPRHARLVPRRLGRDDGRDDVPVGRADGRAVRADDAGALTLRPRSSPAATCWSGRLGRGSPSPSRAAGARLAATRSRGIAPAAGSPGRRSSSAAVYELTPLKDVCLGKCRSPLGFPARLLARRPGRRGADGRPERRLVRRLLLGADGVALRARRHERRLDGVRRRAHRPREDCCPGGASRTTGRRRSSSRSASCCSRRPTRSRAHDPGLGPMPMHGHGFLGGADRME